MESDILVKHELLKSVGEQIGSNECDLVVNGKETSRAQRRRVSDNFMALYFSVFWGFLLIAQYVIILFCIVAYFGQQFH